MAGTYTCPDGTTSVLVIGSAWRGNLLFSEGAWTIVSVPICRLLFTAVCQLML